MFVLVEDFTHLTMSVFSKACVRFPNTDAFYFGCGHKTKFRFEYNEKLKELLWQNAGGSYSSGDFDDLWNIMC